MLFSGAHSSAGVASGEAVPWPFQVAMRGRGALPTPETVNHVFWAAYCFKANPANRDKYIVIHCTHGFNRTG